MKTKTMTYGQAKSACHQFLNLVADEELPQNPEAVEKVIDALVSALMAHKIILILTGDDGEKRMEEEELTLVDKFLEGCDHDSEGFCLLSNAECAGKTC